MPAPGVKRTPFPIGRALPTSLPAHSSFGVVAQASGPDGRDVVRVVQPNNAPLPATTATTAFAIQSHATRPQPHRTPLKLAVPPAALFESEVLNPEMHQRAEIEMEEASLYEVLNLLCTQLQRRSTESGPPQKSRRIEGMERPEGRVSGEYGVMDSSDQQVNVHRYRVRNMLRNWLTPRTMPDRSTILYAVHTGEDASAASFMASDCFPLTNAEEGALVSTWCGRLLARGVRGCGQLLQAFIIDPHGNVELGLQCLLTQLRLRGAEGELVRCVDDLLESSSFMTLPGAVHFLHAVFLMAVGFVGGWSQQHQICVGIGHDFPGAPGSPLWNAMRLLLLSSSRIPVGSVRVEDALVMYRALSAVATLRAGLEDAFGSRSVSHVSEVLLSTLPQQRLVEL